MDLRSRIVEVVAHAGSEAAKAVAEKVIAAFVPTGGPKPENSPAGHASADPASTPPVRDESRYDARVPEATSPPRDEAWLPMVRAPKDGTVVLLLLDTRSGEYAYTVEQGPLVRTLGRNDLEIGGHDAWRIAGYDRPAERFREGVGTPVGFMYLPAATLPGA